MKINFRFISSICLLMIGFNMQAQTFSPHSRFGIGVMQSSTFASNKAMGGIAAGFRGSRDINYLNPASYSGINFTTFSIGLQTNSVIVSDSARLSAATNGGLDHIALAFPIILSKWSMSMGLLPYSSTNYTYSSNVTQNNVNYNYQTKGKGSTYKLYWGNGVQVKNFSVGVNAAFLFGQLSSSQNILFNSDSVSYMNTGTYNELNLKDFVFDFGVQYQTKINKLENEDKDHENIYLTLGAYGAPNYKVKGIQSLYSSSTTTSVFDGSEISVDTATGGSFDQVVQTNVPAYFGIGAVVGNELTWQAGADFQFENWSKFSSPYSSSVMANTYTFKVGAQIMPDYHSKKYGANVNYRIGAQFGKSRILYNGKSLPEFGMTFGFGLPLGKVSGNNRSVSRLNACFELGKRGAANPTVLKENYYKLTLSYSLSDRWFIKRKFD